MFQSLKLYLDFKGAKDIHVLQVLIWGFGRCWRFLTGVWGLDIYFDMVTSLQYTLIQILNLYIDFEGAKNIQGFGGC